MDRRSTPEEIGVGAAAGQALVVGFDGSPSGASAIEWAAREAAVRAVPLRIVSYGTPKCEQLADTIDAVRQRHPELSIEDTSTHLDPRDALLEAASSTDLLIIGAPSSGTVRRWLLGSVPRTAARRSASPVIVVRGRPRPHLRRIVVGVDSSNAAAAALDWALAEAECHGSELLVVHAWQRSRVAGPSLRATDLDRSDAQCVVDLALRHCEKRTNLPVGGELIDGDAAAVLMTASRHADLLVVGSRGRSGFKTMLFGSVALFVAGHSACPVAVVHPHVRSE